MYDDFHSWQVALSVSAQETACEEAQGLLRSGSGHKVLPHAETTRTGKGLGHYAETARTDINERREVPDNHCKKQYEHELFVYIRNGVHRKHKTTRDYLQ